MIPILGLIIGLIAGLLIPAQIPEGYTVYMAVIVLAVIDSVIGGYVSSLQGRFELKLFITGILGNIIIAVALTFFGEQVDVPLYIAPVFTFGNRLFNNFATLRRLEIAKIERIRADRKAAKKLENEKKEDDK